MMYDNFQFFLFIAGVDKLNKWVIVNITQRVGKDEEWNHLLQQKAKKREGSRREPSLFFNETEKIKIRFYAA